MTEIKTKEQIISEIERVIEEKKKRGVYSHAAFSIVMEDAAPEAIRRHFSAENGYYYVKVESCGCKNKSYDILIQWLEDEQ